MEFHYSNKNKWDMINQNKRKIPEASGAGRPFPSVERAAVWPGRKKSERDSMREKKWILSLIFTLFLIGVLVVLMWQTGFFQAVGSISELQAYIQRWAPYSHLIYFLVQFASVILAPIPSNITAAAGAVMFGTLPSFLLTAAAVLCGSVVVFLLARVLGGAFVDRVVSRRLSQRYLTVIRNKRDSFLVLAFLFPFFPDDLICILAGLTDISLTRFLVIAVLTRPWGLLVACAVGGSTLLIPSWGMALIGVGGAALFVLGMKYGDRVEKWLIAHLHTQRNKEQ